MSIQDKIEHILKEIHLLFSQSQSYAKDDTRIVVEKQKVFALLEQLNMAVYEVMDEYEVTSQKQVLAERRSEKRGEEIIGKANKHADDIYAASIIYTDDALSRIQHIMDDTNKSVQKIFRRMNAELDSEKEKVRDNQSELKEQLRDFADTDKYLKVIKEQNIEREKEQQEKLDPSKEKKIANEGRSYSAIQPEIRINKAYFERAGKECEVFDQQREEQESEAEESLSKITGKEFAESLRRRAALGGIPEEREERPFADVVPEVRVNQNAEYFKKRKTETKDSRFSFGKK